MYLLMLKELLSVYKLDNESGSAKGRSASADRRSDKASNKNEQIISLIGNSGKY